MKKLLISFLIFAGALCQLIAQPADSVFTTLNFGCDGNSITAGLQWSETVVRQLGLASHHNVAVGSATFATYPDTQEYDSYVFSGISDGWKPTTDSVEMQKRHNNVSKVHIQRFIKEVENGLYPAPDIFVFSMGTNDTRPGDATSALKEKSLSDIDLTTMAGGARWAIQTIRETYPDCSVFLCTPIQSGDPERNRLNREKITILRAICQAYSVRVIDCYTNSGILEEFEQPAGPGRYLRDGLHPDKAGQELMGDYIAREIRTAFTNDEALKQ